MPDGWSKLVAPTELSTRSEINQNKKYETRGDCLLQMRIVGTIQNGYFCHDKLLLESISMVMIIGNILCEYIDNSIVLLKIQLVTGKYVFIC